MKITKVMLEEEVKRLNKENNELFTKNSVLKEQLEWYKRNSAAGQTSAMVIAVERTTDALARVISDMKYFDAKNRRG